MDHGYHAIFTPITLYLEYQLDKTQSFQGYQYTQTKMWPIVLQKPAPIAHENIDKYLRTGQHMEANNMPDFTLNREIVQYLH